jgi:hypothetical protein
VKGIPDADEMWREAHLFFHKEYLEKLEDIGCEIRSAAIRGQTQYIIEDVGISEITYYNILNKLVQKRYIVGYLRAGEKIVGLDISWSKI